MIFLIKQKLIGYSFKDYFRSNIVGMLNRNDKFIIDKLYLINSLTSRNLFRS